LNKKRKKRSFLLIEVLLAIALIGLCAYPLLAPHFMIAQTEIKSLEQRKLERVADQTYAELVQGLYENTVPSLNGVDKVHWKSFDSTIQGSFLEPAMITMNDGRVVKFLRKYEIAQVLEGRKKDKKSEQYRLLEVHLKFIKEGRDDLFAEYSYRVSIETQ
jgi:type II secretory pathway pseudopilin PulG